MDSRNKAFNGLLIPQQQVTWVVPGKGSSDLFAPFFEKLLSEQLINDEGLLTVMAEVERILNDRPLWSPSSDPMDDGPLTLNHLLLVQPNSSLPLGLFSKDDNYSRRWWKQANYLIEIFWKRWMKQYLPSLQVRRKWNTQQENIKTGDIVLVEECTPRGQWPLGIIVATYPDRRGVVRIVDVKMRKSVYR